MSKVSNWGNTPSVDATVIPFHTLDQLEETLRHTRELIPRGMGRCYGDSSLNERILSTTQFNQIKQFDQKTGQLICESGVSFDAILSKIVPNGWFLPVTPGTKFVTIGGAVAADVHGKNHHISGSLSKHLIYIDVMTSNQTVTRCSSDIQPSLFHGTCGGMGLTGIITEVCMQLIPIESAYIRQEIIRSNTLEESMSLFDHTKHWTYSVAWIDCLAKGAQLGRSILMVGEHAIPSDLTNKQRHNPLQLPKKKKRSVPFFFPNWMLNSWSVKCFNTLYFHRSPKSPKTSIVDYDSFFYPLDDIYHWNRLYGKRGFTQYQCVFPLASSKDGLTELLTKISDSGQGSFLAVLKRFGKQDDLLSFPMEGYTLALDFPMTKKVITLLDELDVIVARHHGRLYLAKDCRMSEAFFKSSYKNSDRFIQYKHEIDTNNHFQSLQSKRLGI